MTKLSVKNLLRNFGIIITLICLCMALSAWLIMRQANQLLDEQVDTSIDALDAFSDAKFSIIQIQQYLTDAAVTGDLHGIADAEQYLQAAQQQLKQAAASAAVPAPAVVPLAASISTDADRLFTTGKQMVAAYDTGRDQGNAIMKAPGGFDEQALKLAEDIERASAQLTVVRNDARQALDDTLESALTIILPATVVVVVAVAWGMIWLNRFLFGVLGGEPREASDLAERLERGELAVAQYRNVKADSLLGSLLAMCRRWTDMATALRGQASILSSQSDDMNRQALVLAKSVAQQQRESDGIRLALDSLQTVSQRVSSSADGTASIVAQVGQQSATNTSAVLAVSDHIRQLAETVQHATDQIHALDVRAADIASIVTTIRSIAEQTNLLALNAAIEAARAGESGRGFAVVADEVRNLAARTSSATTDITAKISEVHQATQKIVESIAAASESVVAGISLTDQATTGMQSINAASQNAELQMHHIQQAVHDQESAVARISSNVEEIVRTIQENATQAERLSQAAGHLGELSGLIVKDVSFFQLANQDQSFADATLF